MLFPYDKSFSSRRLVCLPVICFISAEIALPTSLMNETVFIVVVFLASTLIASRGTYRVSELRRALFGPAPFLLRLGTSPMQLEYCDVS